MLKKNDLVDDDEEENGEAEGDGLDGEKDKGGEDAPLQPLRLERERSAEVAKLSQSHPIITTVKLVSTATK